MSNKFKDIMYTIPFVIIIALKYSLNIEKESDGDPVDLILGDKVLLCLTAIFAIIMGAILYS